MEVSSSPSSSWDDINFFGFQTGLIPERVLMQWKKSDSRYKEKTLQDLDEAQARASHNQRKLRLEKLLALRRRARLVRHSVEMNQWRFDLNQLRKRKQLRARQLAAASMRKALLRSRVQQRRKPISSEDKGLDIRLERLHFRLSAATTRRNRALQRTKHMMAMHGFNVKCRSTLHRLLEQRTLLAKERILRQRLQDAAARRQHQLAVRTLAAGSENRSVKGALAKQRANLRWKMMLREQRAMDAVYHNQRNRTAFAKMDLNRVRTVTTLKELQRRRKQIFLTLSARKGHYHRAVWRRERVRFAVKNNARVDAVRTAQQELLLEKSFQIDSRILSACCRRLAFLLFRKIQLQRENKRVEAARERRSKQRQARQERTQAAQIRAAMRREALLILKSRACRQHNTHVKEAVSQAQFLRQSNSSKKRSQWLLKTNTGAAKKECALISRSLSCRLHNEWVRTVWATRFLRIEGAAATLHDLEKKARFFDRPILQVRVVT